MSSGLGIVICLPRYIQKAPLFKAGMNGKLKLNYQESPIPLQKTFVTGWGVTGFTNLCCIMPNIG